MAGPSEPVAAAIGRSRIDAGPASKRGGAPAAVYISRPALLFCICRPGGWAHRRRPGLMASFAALKATAWRLLLYDGHRCGFGGATLAGLRLKINGAQLFGSAATAACWRHLSLLGVLRPAAGVWAAPFQAAAVAGACRTRSPWGYSWPCTPPVYSSWRRTELQLGPASASVAPGGLLKRLPSRIPGNRCLLTASQRTVLARPCCRELIWPCSSDPPTLATFPARRASPTTTQVRYLYPSSSTGVPAGRGRFAAAWSMSRQSPPAPGPGAQQPPGARDT